MKDSLINLGGFTSGVGELLGAVLMGVGIYLTARLKKHLEKKDFFSVENVLNRNLRVQTILHECRGFFDCDRVKLFQFHNGDYFLSGESVQKISLTHFALKRGVGSPITNPPIYQNIPVSVILNCLDRIKDPGKIYFECVEDLPDEFYMKDAFRLAGSKTVAITAVRNQYGRIFGILILTWLDEIKQPERLKETHSFAQDLGLEIAYQNRR